MELKLRTDLNEIGSTLVCCSNMFVSCNIPSWVLNIAYERIVVSTKGLGCYLSLDLSYLPRVVSHDRFSIDYNRG